jgi:thiol-disulfide isomerase/thioredoxin
MKKYIVIAGLLISASFGVQAQQFDLKGKIIGQGSGYLHISYHGKGDTNLNDSCAIKDGSFEFKGAISQAAIAYFDGAVKSRSVDDPNAVSFFLEPGDMAISLTAGHFKDAIITGSKTQDENVELEKRKAAIYAEMKPLDDAYKQADLNLHNAERQHADDIAIKELTEKAAAIHDKFDPYRMRLQNVDTRYFTEHPTSYLTAWRLRFYTSSLPLDSLQFFYSRLGATVQQSAYGKTLAEQITKMRAGIPGHVAADFTADDLNGKQLTLSSFKGKYVILDFWASWCVPCRHSNPHMIQVYNKYHDKGLEIIGVASDDNRPEAWKKAVSADSVGIWHNVLDGLDWAKLKKGEKNDEEIGNKFGIHTIPTKIIIDPSGTIIGRYGDNIGGSEEDMDKLLASIFNK